MRADVVTYKITLVFIAGLLMMSCGTTKQSLKVKRDTPPPKEVGELDSDKQREFEYIFIEGLKQKALGNTDYAIPLFSSCIDIDPNSSAALYELARINTAKGDFTSAMMLLEKAVKLNPGNKYYRLLLAKIYLQNNKFYKVADQYAELVELYPNNIDYKFTYASLLVSLGEYDEALKVYGIIEKETGINESLSIAIQQLYSQKGDPQKGYAELQKLIDSDPSKPQYYLLLGDAYIDDKKMKEALESYNKAIEIDSDNGFGHISLFNYYRENEDMDEAYIHLQKACESEALEPEIKLQIYALVTHSDNRIITDEQEKNLLKTLIEVHSHEESVRSVYIAYLIKNTQYEEARNELRFIINIKKDSYAFWEQLLLLNHQLSDWKAIIADSEEAIKYFPSQPFPYISKSIGLLQKEKYREVLEVLEKGIEHYTENDPKILTQFHLYKAESLIKLEMNEDAYNMFEKAIKEDPFNYMAMNNYAYYLSEKGERLDRAEKLSGLVIKDNPNNAIYLDTYAWVLFKKKNYKLAKFYMEFAISNGGENNPVLVEHYGDILYFLNEKEKALENWKQALEMGSESAVLKEKIAKQAYIEDNK